MTATREFLEALFGELVSEDHRLVVWGKGEGSVWASTIEWALKALSPERPYIHACLHHLMGGGDARMRGSIDTAMVVPGYWADIDTRVKGKKKAYPPTLKDAYIVAAGHPMGPPTAILETGGGLHVWWLFEEPWILTSEEEREEASRRSAGFGAALQDVAAKHDWVLDSVFDLARILRTPGVTNSKYGVEASLAASGGPRYEPSDIDLFIPEGVQGRTGALGVSGQDGDGSFLMVPDPKPPAKLAATLELDTKLKRTWENKRRDLDGDSELELALASLLLGCGWTDQEVVDTCRAWRMQHGDKTGKEDRPDYYVRTMARARRGQRQVEGLGELEALAEDAIVAEELQTEDGASEHRTRVEATVKGLNSLLGFSNGRGVAKLLRWPGDPPTYGVRATDGREITLGESGSLATCHALEARMIDLFGPLGLLPVSVRRAKGWAPVRLALLAGVEDVDLGEDMTVLGEIAAMLEHVFDAYTPIRLEHEPERWDSAVRAGRPICHRGVTLVSLDCLLGASSARHGGFTKRSLAKRLKQAGFVRTKVATKGAGKPRQRWMWGARPK